MDAVLAATVIATIVFGALSVWSLYIRRRDHKRELMDTSFVVTFISLWIILTLLLLGVLWYIAYPLVFIAVAIGARLRRRSWKRMLDTYKK